MQYKIICVLYVVMQGENLYLSSLSKMDQGVFRCIANNDVRPPAPYDTTLYVDFQPTAIPVQTTYGQSQNKLYNLIIECIVSGTFLLITA